MLRARGASAEHDANGSICHVLVVDQANKTPRNQLAQTNAATIIAFLGRLGLLRSESEQIKAMVIVESW